MGGLIPDSFIEELLGRIDIVDVIERRVPLKRAGREFQACCPFHDEKTPSFTVSPQKQFYHCFGCGEHGSAIGFLMNFEGLEFVDAVEDLARQAGLEVPREAVRAARPSADLYDVLESASTFYQNQLKSSPEAIDYLKKRGLSGEISRYFEIGYAPPGWDKLSKDLATDDHRKSLLKRGGMLSEGKSGEYDKFRHRIMFPIHDRRGRVIGFGGRALDDDGPKYFNSPETELFHKGRELYGLYEARQALRHIEQLVVVEGYMDTVALARHGIEFVVATLGTATTNEHLNRLFRLTENVYFSFDGDRAGKKAAWRALENALPQVREGRQIRFVFLPEGQDPDSFVNENGADAFVKLMDAGLPLSEFLIQELSSQVDMDTIDGRAKLAEMARPLINNIPAGVYRELLIESLATAVGLTAPKLEKMMAAGQAGGTRSERARAGATPRRRQPSASGGPSVVRRAITLILNHPEAGQTLDVEALAGVQRAGVDLLSALIETVQSEPNITTAGLLERWRHDEKGRHLGKLAAEDVPVDEDFDPAAELAECLQQLALIGCQERIAVLIEKQRVAGLMDEEKSELMRLMETRNSMK